MHVPLLIMMVFLLLQDGWNTLHYASASGSLEIVKYLMVKYKMDPKTVKKVRHALMCFSKVNPVMCIVAL